MIGAHGCKGESDRQPKASATPRRKIVPKILIVSGLRVWPVASGGQLRTSGFASALARMGYDTTVYSLTGRRPDYSRLRPWRDPHFTDAIESRLCETTYLGIGPAVAHALSRYRRRPRSWMLSMTGGGKYPDRLRDLIDESDAIVADHSYVAPPTEAARTGDKPWYLLSHQLEHVLLRQGNAADRRFAAAMELHERAAPKLYADIFACAEEDRDYFRSHSRDNTVKVPIIRCGVDSSRYRWTDADRHTTRRRLGLSDAETVLLFAGSNYAPNLEALSDLKAFVHRERNFLERSRIRFLILGSMESQPYNDGIIIATGRVPAVLPYFAAADAGLNPVLRGAGSNVKLFEYLAARLPVLSTAFGIRGSGLTAGEDYVEFGGSTLRDALHTLLSARGRPEWREFAERVWERHRKTVEIDAAVQAAVAVAARFPAP
jgi:glycosyltransferase involved in cell wall biosynthesis